MNKKYLPLGTVVVLKGATKNMMIIGYVQVDTAQNNKIWDYVGCPYPEGYLSSDRVLLFNHDQIDKIFALGFSDGEHKNFSIRIHDEVDMFTGKDM